MPRIYNAPPGFVMNPAGLTDELRAEIKRLQDLLFARGAMAEAPCFCCGYNGPGYFQVEAHPCAERHLLAMSEAG